MGWKARFPLLPREGEALPAVGHQPCPSGHGIPVPPSRQSGSWVVLRGRHGGDGAVVLVPMLWSSCAMPCQLGFFQPKCSTEASGVSWSCWCSSSGHLGTVVLSCSGVGRRFGANLSLSTNFDSVRKVLNIILFIIFFFCLRLSLPFFIKEEGLFIWLVGSEDCLKFLLGWCCAGNLHTHICKSRWQRPYLLLWTGG